jgi:hypothetical protein
MDIITAGKEAGRVTENTLWLNAYPFPLPATTHTREIDPYAQWKNYAAPYWIRTLLRSESRRAWKSVTNAPAITS